MVFTKYISWCSIFLFKIAIPQRELKQISSHTQKFYIKLKKCKDIELEIDFTSEHIKNIKDMIHYIKSLNKDYNIFLLFLYLSENCNRKKKIKNKRTIKYFMQRYK